MRGNGISGSMLSATLPDGDGRWGKLHHHRLAVSQLRCTDIILNFLQPFHSVLREVLNHNTASATAPLSPELVKAKSVLSHCSCVFAHSVFKHSAPSSRNPVSHFTVSG